MSSVQEGVQRARRESYAFIVDSPMAAYVSGRPPCDLYVTEPFLVQMKYAFAVRRGFTTHLLSHSKLKLRYFNLF